MDDRKLNTTAVFSVESPDKTFVASWRLFF